MTSKQPRTKYRPDEIMIQQVRGAKRIGDDLMAVFRRGIGEQLSDLVAGREIPPHHTDEFLERFVAAVLIMPVLRALATELALKAIASKRRGKHPHGHDLRKLYDDLDADIRQRAEQEAASQYLPPVRDTLANHKNDFVEWRYLAEAATLNTNPNDLDKALAILLSIYDVV